MYQLESVNIIIVDDSDLVCDSVKKMLAEIPGIKIAGCAAHSSEVLKLIKEKKPDAVILDINTQNENGLEVLKKIKNTNPHTVVIIFTNSPSSQYKAMCYRTGADYFLDKSIGFQLIADVLREMAMGHYYYIYN